MKSACKNVLAVILAFLMVVLFVPQNVIADLAIEESSETITDKPLEVVEEVTSLREENVKHYRMSDGSFVAVQYAEPVHYLDDNSKWQDIDNSLIDSSDYVGTKNGQILFAKNSKKDSAVLTLNDDNYSIKIYLNEEVTEVSSKAANNKTKFSASATSLEKASTLDKLSSSIKYNNIIKGIDLEYRLVSNYIKENIIVNQKSDNYSYKFILELKNLEAVYEKDIINLIDKKTGEIQYYIPAPYMYDSADNRSDEVYYTLNDLGGGKYEFTVTADANWINDSETVFPVTIDPTVVHTNSTLLSNIKDAYIIEHYPDLLTGEYAWMYTGYYSGMEDISLVGIRTLPVLPKSSVVIKAELGLKTYDDTSTSVVNVGAYEILEDWEAGEVTWNTRPSYSNTLIDYVATQGVGEYTFDLTSLANNWYSDPTNHPSARGVALIALNEDADIVKFSTVNNTSFNANYPIFIVSYRDNKGLEDRWTYHTQDIGDNVTGYINDYSGNLVMDVDLGLDTGTLPIYAESIFNTYLINTEFFTAHKNGLTSISAMQFGYGWQLSLMQTLVTVNDYYCYTDADGTDHYFILDNGAYIDEDGLGYTVEIYGSYLRLTTPGDVIMDFYTGTYAGAIYQITTDDETYTYHYSTSTGTRKLTSITDSGNNTILSFTYILDYLDSITDADSNTASFTYTYGKLTGITCGNGNYYTIAYSGTTGTLYTIRENANSYYQTYLYTSANGIYRVTDIIQSYSGSNSYTSMTISYPTLKTTVFVTAGTDDNPVYSSDNLKTVYQFDNFGRTVNAYTTNYSGNTIYDATMVSYQATDTSTTEAGQNNVQTLASSGSGAINLLRSSSAVSTSYWLAKTYGSSVTGSYARTTTDKFIGTYSLKLNPTASNTSYYGYYQTVSSLAAGTYTFSAYVKTTSITSSSGGAFIGIFKSLTSTASPSDVSEKITGTTNTDLQNGWRRISVTFTLTAATTIYPFVGTYASTGTAYFDCMQLEKGDTYNDYNLIDNSSFEATNAEWTLSNVTWGTGTGSLSNNAISFSGSYTATKTVSQTVNLNMPAGTTFVVSGWAKANSLPIPIENETRKFAIKVFINYATATDVTEYYSFNPSNTNWQYVCAAITPVEDDTITSITVSFDYSYNSNSVLFDNLTLNVGGVYTFDNSEEEEEEGELLPVEGTTDQKYQIIDDIKYTYTYDTNDNIIATVMEFVGESGTNSSNKFYTSSTYNNDGDMLTNTDELGHTTSYTYSNGLLSSMTDANNHTTNYSYTDDLLTRLYQTIGTLQIANNYSYDDDGTLTGVTHTSGANILERYSFTYNVYGDLISIYQGDTSTGTALVTYAYNSYRGKLISATYANGFVESYTYDALDRLSAVSYNSVVKYSYKYDNKGNLLEVIDAVNSTTEKYEYDFKGNCIRKYQVNTSSKSFVCNYEYIYNAEGEQTGYKYSYPDGTVKGYEAVYNDDGQLIRENLSSGEYIVHTYDVFGREYSVIAYKSDDSLLFGSSYNYTSGSGGVNASSYNVYQVANSDMIDFQYTYDGNGNIITITNDSNDIASYEYDALGQLVRENNAVSDKTYVYQYDNSGNITYKFIIDYDDTTATNLLPLAAGTIIPYTYGNTTNKDLLTSYNGTSISYDNLGNPTNWRNATSITWTGRQLAKFDKSSVEYLTYKYNSDGIRTQKNYAYPGTYYNATHDYYLDGSIITGEKISAVWSTGSSTTYQYYYYDADGSPIGINYNGTDYYFRKNLQGDIECIYSEAGTKVVTYTYDAWGNTTSITGSMATSLGVKNPFRYRGYYFDTETGLFYVGSRYYDPEIGRFINADMPETMLLSDNILGTNLFAYCYNNPVMFTDSTGYSPIQAVFAAIGAIAGWFLGDYVARQLGYAPSGKGWWNATKYWTLRAGFVVGGAVIGWFAAGALVSILKGFIFSSPTLIAKTPIFVYKFLGINVGAGSVVLGKWPTYVTLAQRLGSQIFSIAQKVYNSMTAAQQWAANRAFLDKIIQNGQKVTLQVQASKATGTFLREINYLLSKGYKIVENGWAMVKK